MSGNERVEPGAATPRAPGLRQGVGRPVGTGSRPISGAPAAAEMLERLIAGAPHAIAVTEGASHRICRVNPAFCRAMRVEPEDVLGRPYTAAFPEPAGEGPAPVLDRVLRTGRTEEDHEIARRRADGSHAVWSYTVWPLGGGSDAAAGLVVEVHDRTEQIESVRRLEEMAEQIRQINERLLGSALREQEWAEKAEAANRAKSNFLAMMSHELRTPLSGIIGYTEVLVAGILGPVDERQREALHRISTCSSHLLELIEGVLSFAQIEARALELRHERVDISELARQAAAIVEPLAKKKGLHLSVDVPAAPVAVETDPHKVRQILLNLLGNAVKFTEKGEVRLELRDRSAEIRLLVRDTGVGIPPDELERVFEPFVQREAVMTRRAGGSGLGLAISRSLAKLLGGSLHAQSTLGSGSTFWIDLPRAAPSASAVR